MQLSIATKQVGDGPSQTLARAALLFGDRPAVIDGERRIELAARAEGVMTGGMISLLLAQRSRGLWSI
jgi:hypothetical protein